MNANELTALIGECLRETDDHEFFLKLESVLRQQQAEIEALKLARLADLDVILKQRAEIELLFKEIPEWKEIVNRNCNKPNPHVGNLDKEEYVYKMGDIDWTKALK